MKRNFVNFKNVDITDGFWKKRIASKRPLFSNCFFTFSTVNGISAS